MTAVGLEDLSGSRFDAHGLLGKLASFQGDQGYFESADESALKKLTGGDLCRFEAKGKQPFYQPNRCKLVFACNQLPTFRDRSRGTWRRAVLVPFGLPLAERDRDPALQTPEYWADELPGFLNWALDGLARLRARGRFDLPPACRALVDQHRRDSDPLRTFLEEHYELTGAAADRVATRDLYGQYKSWCEYNHFDRPVNVITFGK